MKKFRLFRLSFAFLTVLCWLVATQHCVLAQLWTDSNQKATFSATEPDHHHCSRNSENKKSSAPSSKEGCEKKECCQPLIRAYQESSIEKVAPLDPLVKRDHSSFEHAVIVTSADAQGLPLTTAPPFHREKTFLRLSLLAPNAPPLFF